MVEFQATVTLGAILEVASVLLSAISLGFAIFKMHLDGVRRSHTMHVENVQRFSRLETKVDLIYDNVAVRFGAGHEN